MSRSASPLPASAAAILRSPSSEQRAVMSSIGSARPNISSGHSNRWRPGLPEPAQHPCHNEIFASSNEGAGAGFALALARDAMKVEARGPLQEADDQRHILWVQTRDAMKRGGRPYTHGLPDELRRRVIHVAADNAQDALFALEEGVRCRDLAFVMGEVLGNPRELDFTASRRLTLTAQKHGSRLYLVRIDAKPDLSSARMRWNAQSAPSPRPRWDANAPGMSAWKAELFRARGHPYGKWTLYDDEGSLSIPAAISASITGQPSIISPASASTPAKASGYSPARAADYGNMARATVGQSLAAL